MKTWENDDGIMVIEYDTAKYIGNLHCTAKVHQKYRVGTVSDKRPQWCVRGGYGKTEAFWPAQLPDANQVSLQKTNAAAITFCLAALITLPLGLRSRLLLTT